MPSLIGPATLATTNPYSDAYNGALGIAQQQERLRGHVRRVGRLPADFARCLEYLRFQPRPRQPGPSRLPPHPHRRHGPRTAERSGFHIMSRTSWSLRSRFAPARSSKACSWIASVPIRRAMLSWRQYVRDVVTWNGEPCVFDVDSKPLKIKANHVEGEDKDNMPEESRGYEQWIGLWRTTIRFYFQTTAMRGI